MKKAIHFGAGNIGRGFIGLLLSLSGYEVVFVDLDDDLVSDINDVESYQVVEVGNSKQEYSVDNIRAINGSDVASVAQEIEDANLVTTAVGANNLQYIAPAIIKGLKERLEGRDQDYLNIIACENAVRASTDLKEYVYEKLDESKRDTAESYVGFPDSAVDRIVPPQECDGLKIKVEPFSEWIVDETQIKGPTPEIEGMKLTDNLLAFVERKIFTLNTGHAGVAYLGYYKGYEYIHEAIKDEEVHQIVKEALLESGSSLIKLYGFDKETHRKYIEKILKRFENKELMDSVTRVGRDPRRKLGPKDRLVNPAVRAFENGRFPENLCKCIAAGLLFDVEEDKSAKQIQDSIAEKGVVETLENVTGLSSESDIGERVLNEYNSL
ncbi:mannitol-1-phosphate 5-dehydrogenase [Halanaerocella petrolearia]